MGAYQIFKIEFKGKEVRDFFEKLEFKPKRLFQYKDGEEYDCVYYMGLDGYGLGGMCLEKIRKAKILNKIKSFKSIDLSCGNNWYNELKRYKEEMPSMSSKEKSITFKVKGGKQVTFKGRR